LALAAAGASAAGAAAAFTGGFLTTLAGAGVCACTNRPDVASSRAPTCSADFANDLKFIVNLKTWWPAAPAQRWDDATLPCKARLAGLPTWRDTGDPNNQTGAPMKVVKWLLSGVLALAGILLLGGMLLSPKFSVSRSVSINAPAAKIYPMVADPRGWKAWSVWNLRDPAMQITYSGPASGVGAVWAWHSASEGDGKMTFTAAEPDKQLGYDLYFPDFGTTSSGALTFTPEGAATRVTWTMNGDMGSNPLYHWMALFTDKMVGKDFEAGLANLKRQAEKT
jgi:uncharacterized protein YndB with AHSA1/START domain